MKKLIIFILTATISDYLFANSVIASSTSSNSIEHSISDEKTQSLLKSENALNEKHQNSENNITKAQINIDNCELRDQPEKIIYLKDNNQNWEKYISPFFMIIGLILNGYIFYLTIKRADETKNKEFYDDYWLRTIIIPTIQRSANNFTENQLNFWKNEIKSKRTYNDKGIKKYLEQNLQAGTHSIFLKIDAIEVVDLKMAKIFSEKAEEIIDNFENKVAQECQRLVQSKASHYESIIQTIIIQIEQLEFNLILAFQKPHEELHNRTASPH